MNKSLKEKRSVLDWIEYTGNKLPHPVTIFLILTLLVIIISHVLYLTGVSVSYVELIRNLASRKN